MGLYLSLSIYAFLCLFLICRINISFSSACFFALSFCLLPVSNPPYHLYSLLSIHHMISFLFITGIMVNTFSTHNTYCLCTTSNNTRVTHNSIYLCLLSVCVCVSCVSVCVCFLSVCLVPACVSVCLSVCMCVCLSLFICVCVMSATGACGCACVCVYLCLFRFHFCL